MSLSSAISNALSGIRASSAAVDIVGNNLANATNENYAKRDLVVEANTGAGMGGVSVVGVRRYSNPVMTATWRSANAAASLSQQASEDISAVQSLYGDPTQDGSLTNRLTQFQESLISAAARPDLTERLSASVMSLDTLVTTVNDIGDGIQRQRASADRQMGYFANRMNDLLSGLDQINNRLVEAQSQGQDLSPLMDEQDKLIDELSSITDIRLYSRDRGTIAIYSSGGARLLDNGAAKIEFEPASVMTATMTVAGGELSALTIDGVAMTAGTDSGKLRGGQLGALAEFRDVTSVNEQHQIDSFAFELATRLNDPALDSTRMAGDRGFLTDQGNDVDAATLMGLSNRLAVNETMNPLEGGDPTLLRDGLLALAPGPVGNASILNGLVDTLTTADTVANGVFSGETISLEGLALRLTNRVAYESTRLEEAEVFAVTQSETLRGYRLENAVDSDAELQKLMQLEQAYAANAQVLRSVDEMMDVLLGVV